MPPPADRDAVQSAIRLGWYVAEVRGRNRPDGPRGVSVIVPERDGFPLPLRIERTAEELRIEAQDTLGFLARKLRVDARPDGSYFEVEIDRAARDLAQVRQNPSSSASSATRPWEALSGLIFEFDAHAQDLLTATSDTQACGYQLGRGLAECYWALDPDASKGWSSWLFLFDPLRCSELSRLSGRLSGYLQTYSAPAIAGSLEVWKLVARDTEWRRQPTVRADLYNQIRNWYELLVLDQDPTRIIRPYRLIRNWRVTFKAATTFLPQLLLGAVSLAAVLVFTFAVSSPHPARWLEALTSSLGAVGLTVATITAKLKNEAQALSTRLKQDAYTDLICESITTVPRLPRRRRGPSSQTILEKAVRNRTITPSTPLN